MTALGGAPTSAERSSASPGAPGDPSEEWRPRARRPFVEPGDDDGMSLAAWVAGALGHWRMVVRSVVLAIAIATVAALTLPPKFVSETSFVTGGSKGMKLSQAASSLPGLAGIATQLGVGGAGADASESPDFYLELITSRELLTRLLASRFRDPRGRTPADSATLLEIMRIRHESPARQRELAIKKLRRSVIGARANNKTNVVTIGVELRWPDVSAAVANRVVELVNQFNLERRATQARNRRVFLEGRERAARQELNEAELALRQFYERNRAWEASPGLRFEEGRLRRQVEVASDVYLGLRRDFESARVDEVNDAPLVTVIDSAVVPQKRASPRAGLMIAGGAFAGGMIGLVLAAAAALAADWSRRNPEEAQRLGESFARVRRELPGGRRGSRGSRA